MGNLCSKYFNFNNSTEDLKEKLSDNPKKTPIEDLENHRTKKSNNKIKKNKKSKKKNKKDNDSNNESSDENSESYDSESDSNNDSSDENSDTDSSEDSEKPKKKKKKKEKKKREKNKDNKKESDSEREESEIEDLEQKIIEQSDIQIEKKIVPKYQDLPQKRKLAEYLISNDSNIFKRHLLEVQNLSDEEFNELFEGNTEYQNFNVQNKAKFTQLVAKFDDNQDLIIEWYNREDYYKFILEIWKPNILQKLKEADNQNAKNEILIHFKINTSNWDADFKDYFDIIINQAPIKDLAERMKYYIKEDYGNFDELIKNVDKCKTKIQNSEQTSCKNTIKANIDTTMNKIINGFIPGFLKNTENGFNEFKKEKKKKQEEIANKKISNYIVDTQFTAFDGEINPEDNLKGLSEKNKKLLTKEIKKLYEKENNSCLIDNSVDNIKEMEKIKELSKKFNEEGENFCKMEIKDQTELLFNNEQFKNSVLCLSIANASYTYLHLGKTFMDFNNNFKEFRNELTRIKSNFEKHKKEVELITDDIDIDEAIKQIINTGKKFQEDLDDIDNLINNINNEINKQKAEKTKVYGNTITSAALIVVSAFGSKITNGDNNYLNSTAANIAAIIGNVIDIQKIEESIEEYQKIAKEAEELRKDINKEIDNLRNKFYALSTKHFS